MLEIGLHVSGYLVVLVIERLSLVRDERVLLLAGGPLDLMWGVIGLDETMPPPPPIGHFA